MWGGDPPCDECPKGADYIEEEKKHNERQPELLEKNRIAWNNFLFANRDRPIGFGIAHIPTDAIFFICQLYNLSFNEFEKICIIDNAFVRESRKIQEEKDKKKKQQEQHQQFRNKILKKR